MRSSTTRRATLALLAAGLALPGLSRRSDALQLSDFGGQPGGEDVSDAFARALAAAARRGAELHLSPGTFVLHRPPGEIMDAAEHAMPELRLTQLRLRGAGSERTRLLSMPRRTSANPSLDVSSPLLKSVGAERFSLEGVTLDGAITRLARGLRRGANAEAAALLEIRDVQHCRLRDVTLTGFAGHWDTRDDAAGFYGRRGPLLIANAEEVELDGVTLRHPTFREGPFLHDVRRLTVRGYRFQGPSDLTEGGVSTPLNIMGPQTGAVLVEDFATRGAWGGSLFNLGGPGRFTLRRIRASGSISSLERGTRELPATPSPGNWGKGIDIGGEINHAQGGGQACTELLRLEDVLLENMNVYAIKATRRPDCALGRLSFGPGVRVDHSVAVLSAAYVNEIEGTLVGHRVLRYGGARPGGLAIGLNRCLTGRLHLDLQGATGPDGSGFGVIRAASSGLVLSGQISGFEAGALFDDVRNPREHDRWDALAEDLAISHSTDWPSPAIQLGRSPSRRLREARFARCSLNGQPLAAGMRGLVVHASEVRFL